MGKRVKKAVSQGLGKMKTKKEPLKAKSRVKKEAKVKDSAIENIVMPKTKVKKETLQKKAKAKIKAEGEKLGKLVKTQTKKLKIKKKGWRIQADPVKLNRGVVYLSHIPHGFYEEEMKNYFSQFGVVTAIKMPRSKTGNSRGFAFIEFLHPEVAEVAADTMNNYLMYNRLVKAKYLPPSEQKPHLFRSGSLKETTDSRRRKELRANWKSIDKESVKRFKEGMAKKIAGLKERLKGMGADYQFQVAYESTAFLKSVKKVDPDSEPIVDKEEVNEEEEKERLVEKEETVKRKQRKRRGPGKKGVELGSAASAALGRAKKAVSRKLKASGGAILPPKEPLKRMKDLGKGVRKKVTRRRGSIKRVKLETDV